MGVTASDLFHFVRVHPPSFDLYTCTKICKKSNKYSACILVQWLPGLLFLWPFMFPGLLTIHFSNAYSLV